MTKTGTQNRPYTQDTLLVEATFLDSVPGGDPIPRTSWVFNWNDREQVRAFAAASDKHIRSGGMTVLEPVKG